MKGTIKLAALLMIVSGLCLAQTPGPASTPAGNVENGKRLFTKLDCYWCHGTAGQGSSAGARIGGTALNLQGVMRYVRAPAGSMPAFTEKVLTDQELTDIYAYLKSVQAPKTANVPLLDQLREK
jgi:mono/diheme cytochrome c family protein